MGSPTNEPITATGWETQHSVTLTRGFFMQKTEVTNRQMADVFDWAVSNGLATVSMGSISTVAGTRELLIDLDTGETDLTWDGERLAVEPEVESYPCVGMTWFGAQAYCHYLSLLEHLQPAISLVDWTMDLNADGYRLPTEAEWEYARRAGTVTAFYTGDLVYTGYEIVDPNLDKAGWYWANNDHPLVSSLRTFPVGLKQPNAWGLYDMHGNVFEWCYDWLGKYTTASVVDPIGPTMNRFRVVRGGCSGVRSEHCRSGNRFFHPYESDSSFGFRPARAATP